MSKEETQVKLLKVLLLSQLLLEANEELSETSEYSKTLKFQGKRFEKELENRLKVNIGEKIVNQIDIIHESNPDLMQGVFKSIDSLVEKLSYIGIEYFDDVSVFIDKYLKTKPSGVNRNTRNTRTS